MRNNPSQSFQMIGKAVLPLVVAMTAASAHANQKAPETQAAPASTAQSKQTIIKNISFVGLKRLSPESLYPLLPVTVGGIASQEGMTNGIRALYASEHFAKVEAGLKDNNLVFYVVERPIIAEVSFEGNKLIPTKMLKEGLSKIGLEKGNVLKQATLVRIANELQQQYIAQGYYNSDIKVDQKILEDGRAQVSFDFKEGKPAKVVEINIVGNEFFSDEDIKDIFVLKESEDTRFLSKADRFAQQKLQASLEKLTELYLNAGFVRFSIDNETVNISEDKKKVYIELSLTEGGRYQFGDVNFLGEHGFDTLELQKMVKFRATEKYSQRAMQETMSAFTDFFGDKGFYFAEIKPIPQINDVTKTVNVDFHLDPVRPIYVRNVRFQGNTKTKDEVLRREMRQMEGALASNKNIKLSKSRLMRTGFFKKVDVKLQQIQNRPDKVDIIYDVEEQRTGTSNIAAGYSQSGGVTFQLDLNQRNFLGTGNKVSFGASRSETRNSYNIGYTNPYFTKDGISQSISSYYRETKSDSKNVSEYISDSLGGTLRYGYPVDENIRLSAGLNVDKTDITGGPWMGVSQVDEMIKDGAKVTEYTGDDKGKYNFEKDYMTYNALFGWDYNSFDQPVFPRSGMSHSFDLTLGFGDKTYQKLVYNANMYKPLSKGFIARGYAKLGYGNDLPFYENFYAGGAGSVRGYRPSSLGPRSTAFYDTRVDDNYVPDQVGGNAIATFGTELIMPMPFKGDWTQKIRPALFIEGGQVFDTTDKDSTNFKYKGADTQVPLIQQDEKLRFSAGIGTTWYTAIGPISLSYAKPINDQEGDAVDKVQFQIGNVF